MKVTLNLRLWLFVVAILAVIPLLGTWSALPSAADAPDVVLRPEAPAASPITLRAVADATLKSGFPNANFGGADTLDLEYASGGRTIARVLLRFDLAAGLPSGAVIDSAQLQVLLSSGTGVNPITVRASKVTANWAELGVTWDTAPSIGAPSADAQVGTTQGWVTWDVTAIARGWQTGPNYGLELRGPESGADWYRSFRSRNLVEPAPRLVVTYSVQDATPPSNPTSFTADHTVNQWSNNAWINGHWDGASDGGGSGVYGYSIEWSASPTTVPDDVFDTRSNEGSWRLAEGNWYLHVRTRDTAGNWNPGAFHTGPYKVDLTPPEDPMISSTTHTPGVWSWKTYVQVSWSGAADGAGSGVAGYSIQWDDAPMTVPDTVVDTTGATASATRPHGTTHFHLRTTDVAGNWSSGTHFGPLGIDTQPPSTISNLEVVPASGAAVKLHWSAPADAGSGVYRYDVRWNSVPINGGNWPDSAPLSGVPLPGAPGTAQQMTASGFPKGDTLYFAIRTQDRVTAWSALSNVRNILDLGFRPDLNGYTFANYGDTEPGDLTADDLALMLGHGYVCSNTSWPNPPTYCSPRWWVPSLLTYFIKLTEGGHCNGFTATSVRFFEQIGHPLDYYQPFAQQTSWLLKSNTRRHLMYYWTKQMYEPLESARVASYAATAAQNLFKLQSALSGSQLDPLDMHIWHKDAGGVAGHSILPYALEDRGNGLWRVWVYDNNYPNAMDVFLELDTVANTWSYTPLGWGGGCGSDGNSMGLVPVSLYGQTPDDAAIAAIGAGSPLAPGADTAGIGLAGAGHLLTTDPLGRRIGYVGTELVNEIPGARAHYILGGLGTPLEPMYTVPAGQEYKIVLRGTTTAGAPTMVLFRGSDHIASVEGDQLTTASQNELTVAADAAGLIYRPGRAAGVAAALPAAIEQPTLTLALTGATEDYRLQIVGADVAVGQAVALRADLAMGRLTLDGSQAGSGSYDLVVERSSPAGVRKFLHRNVPVAAGDTQVAQFGSWDGKGAITVQVDHGSDGTVDATLTLDNQMPKIYLPSVMRYR